MDEEIHRDEDVSIKASGMGRWGGACRPVAHGSSSSKPCAGPATPATHSVCSPACCSAGPISPSAGHPVPRLHVPHPGYRCIPHAGAHAVQAGHHAPRWAAGLLMVRMPSGQLQAAKLLHGRPVVRASHYSSQWELQRLPMRGAAAPAHASHCSLHHASCLSLHPSAHLRLSLPAGTPPACVTPPLSQTMLPSFDTWTAACIAECCRTMGGGAARSRSALPPLGLPFPCRL